MPTKPDVQVLRLDIEQRRVGEYYWRIEGRMFRYDEHSRESLSPFAAAAELRPVIEGLIDPTSGYLLEAGDGKTV